MATVLNTKFVLHVVFNRIAGFLDFFPYYGDISSSFVASVWRCQCMYLPSKPPNLDLTTELENPHGDIH